MPTPAMLGGIAHRATVWPREFLAGLSAACITLPFSLAAGVLVFSPLGANFIAYGTAAGLITTAVAGAVSALAASSSFIITAPSASTAIIPAALATYLMGKPAFAAHPHWIVLAIAVCVLLGGLLQVAFGVLGLGRMIKFTPHSVIAGFINSVGLLTMLSPLRPLFAIDRGTLGWIKIEHPARLLFVLAFGVFTFYLGKRAARLPVHLIGIVIATACFYALKSEFPGLDLGRTIGTLPITFPPVSPLADLADADARASLVSIAPQLLLTTMTIAVVVSLQAMLAFRAAQTIAELPPRPPRDLVGQGLGNCASALAGGFVALAVPSPTTTAFRAGGRTRMAGLTASAILLVLAFLFGPPLAEIPIAALGSTLIAVGMQILDPWTLRLPGDVLLNRPGVDRRHAWQSLSVVAAVMALSVTSSIIAGAVAGFALSCLIFIVNMSQPIVRRRFFGDEIFSKRTRSSDDMALLLRTGRQRAVLELQGVLFFGNADALSNLVAELLKDSKAVLLDLRGISDVDVSGATILANLVARAKVHGRSVLFCNVPSSRSASLAQGSLVFADLDSALEWIEEEALRAAGARPADQAIPLAELDLTRDFSAGELALMSSVLVPRDFAPAAVICGEGDAADRMWVLTKGTVSVRLRADHGMRRIASLAAGTTVGEMTMLEASRRSATVTADGDVSTYELGRSAFDAILRDHPQVAQKLLTYFAREMARRLRLLNRDLRSASA